MKRILSVFLAAVLFVTVFSVPSTAQVQEKKFVVDGNLDIWYITALDQYDPKDYNIYDFYELDSYGRDPDNANGVNFYNSPGTSASAYLGYDEKYVYVYVKVWDDQLVSYDLKEEIGSGYDVTMNLPGHTGYADSIEIWFDPDPNSQTHFADGTPRPPKGSVDENGDPVPGAILDGFAANTPDPEQGDIQLRYMAVESQFTTRFNDFYNFVKPGYEGLYFEVYINDTENVCPFTFKDEPRTNEYTGAVVSSGYGIEARFPRNDDDSKAFAINVACNNAATSFEESHALAMGAAWWWDYTTSVKVSYNDKKNPFFNQSEEILASKSVQYTNSVGNQAGAAVVKKINKLPETVTEENRDAVQAALDAYLDLSDVQQGYVKVNNYDKLVAACKTLNIPIGEPDEPVPPVPDTPTDVDGKMGDLNGDEKIDAKDALSVLKISVNKLNPTDEQKVAADVNEDQSINAKDALEILKFSVKKPSVLDKFYPTET